MDGKIVDALDQAYFVHCEVLPVRIAVWHGGNTVNIYNSQFEPIGTFSFGDFEGDYPSRQEAEDAIDKHFG